MELPVNLVIEIKTQQELDDINLLIRSTGHPLESIFARAQYRRKNADSEARVVINGKEIAHGNHGDMTTRYRSECAICPSTNVQLQEWVNGEFKVVSARMIQRR